MRMLRRFFVRLTASATRRQDEERLREEIEDHLRQQTADNIRAGMSPPEARRQAVLQFGAVEAIKEQFRDEKGLPFFERLLHDVPYAVRQLRLSPIFAVTATLSLAVGIGVNAAVFTLVDRVLLRALPVTDPQQLVFVTDHRSLKEPGPRFSYPFYAILGGSNVLNGLAAHFVMAVNASTNDGVARVGGELVSGNYFGVLGAGTQIGRTLTPDDDRSPGSHPVVVIGDGFWRRGFGSDPAVLGRVIRINGSTFTIIGVAAKGFTGTEVGFKTDVWIPMMMQKQIGRDLLTEARTNWLEIIGRLKPGQTAERAGTELTAYVGSRAGALQRPVAGLRLVLLPADKGRSPLRSQLGPALKVLFVLTGLALVLACVNVASLLAVRTVARQKEIAVRLALGASRSSLVRQFLTEILVLAALGGTAGLLLAPWIAGALVRSQPGLIDVDPSLDVRVFLMGLMASLATGLAIGLTPILASSKVRLAGVPADSWTTRRPLRFTAHNMIVTCQIALSLVMLIGAALFVQSLRNLVAIDPGFQRENLLLVSVDPGSAGYDTSRRENFWREAIDRVGRIPGVRSASVARTVPLAPGRQRQPAFNALSGEIVEIDTNFVGPHYFGTLGIQLVRGRDFVEQDGGTSRPVVIVNERMARLFWPDRDAVGMDLRIGPPSSPRSEVVGVVKDAKYRDLRDAGGPMIYLPSRQTRSSDAMTLHIRTENDPVETAATVRRALKALDANLPLFDIRTLDEQLNGFLAPSRQVALLSTGFGIVALLLTAVGVYGVTALAASRQTRSIGIRMALGAQSRHILGAIGRHGLALVIAGLGLGLLGAFGFTRVAGALLYGVTATDLATFAGMSAVLAVISLTAIYVPARAATRLDAVNALRHD